MSYIENKVVNAFAIFMIVIFIMMVMLFYFNYQPYIKVYGEENEEYISIYLTDQEISELNNKLKYKDEIINYKVIDISNEYVILGDQMKRNMKISFNHEKKEYILELYLGLGEETNIWEYLYQKYMKGVI